MDPRPSPDRSRPTNDTSLIISPPHTRAHTGGGKVAYQGPARLAMGWFASLGYVPSQISQSNPTEPSQQKSAMTNVTDFLLDCTSGHIKRQRQGLGQGLGQGQGPGKNDGDDEVDDGQPVVWHELWSARGEAYLSGALRLEAHAHGSAASHDRDASGDDWVASGGEYSGSHDTIPPPPNAAPVSASTEVPTARSMSHHVLRGAMVDLEAGGGVGGGGGVHRDSAVQRAATVKVRSFPRQLVLYVHRAFLQRIKGFDMVGVDGLDGHLCDTMMGRQTHPLTPSHILV